MSQGNTLLDDFHWDVQVRFSDPRLFPWQKYDPRAIMESTSPANDEGVNYWFLSIFAASLQRPEGKEVYQANKEVILTFLRRLIDESQSKDIVAIAQWLWDQFPEDDHCLCPQEDCFGDNDT